MIDLVQNTIDGVMIGSSYGLLALGFTLIFGVMRRLDLAYGPSIMIGGYFGTVLYLYYGAGPLAVASAVVLGAGVRGIHFQPARFSPAKKRRPRYHINRSLFPDRAPSRRAAFPAFPPPYLSLSTARSRRAARIRALPGTSRSSHHAGLRARTGGGRASRALSHSFRP